jgi:hypothetical protein
MHVIIQGDAVKLSARLIRQILIFGFRPEFGPDQLYIPVLNVVQPQPTVQFR